MLLVVYWHPTISPSTECGQGAKKMECDGSIEIEYGKLIIKDIATFGARYDKLLLAEPLVPND